MRKNDSIVLLLPALKQHVQEQVSDTFDEGTVWDLAWLFAKYISAMPKFLCNWNWKSESITKC